MYIIYYLYYMLYVYIMYISVCHIIIDVYHISDHMFF